MNYYKCKCGKKEYWESGMPVHDCMGCDECNTTYATHLEGHKPLKPHEWKVMYNERTGKPYNICSKCYHVDEVSYKESQKDTEKEKPPCLKAHKTNNMSKKLVYVVKNDEATGANLVQETIDDLKDYIDFYVDGMQNGETINLEITRVEMDEEELANLPEAD